MSVTPKSSWPWVRTLLHSVFDQPDAESVAAQYDRIIDALSDKLPNVADHLEAARPDLLAFTAFPKQIWRQIWSNNPQVICSAAVSVFYVDHEGSEWSVLRSGCGYLQPSMKQILEGRCACCEGGFTALVA
jgi:putative transposase